MLHTHLSWHDLSCSSSSVPITPKIINFRISSTDCIGFSFCEFGRTMEKAATTSKSKLLKERDDFIKGRFTIIQNIGEGTYGRVWSAIDKATEKKVALKLVKQVDKPSFHEELKLHNALEKRPTFPNPPWEICHVRCLVEVVVATRYVHFLLQLSLQGWYLISSDVRKIHTVIHTVSQSQSHVFDHSVTM